MHLRVIRKSLLIMALALGQWLVLAHALQHPALAQDQACQLCLHAPALDGGAVPPPPPALTALPPPPNETTALVARRPLPAAGCRHPIRGPPTLSA